MNLFSRLSHVAAIIVTMVTIAIMPLSSHAAQFLTADEAFVLHTDRQTDGSLRLRWTIADGHYLYRDHTKVKTDGQVLAATLSSGMEKDDPGFGLVRVWFDRGEAVIGSQALIRAGNPARVQVTYQGCQDGSVCFPPTTQDIEVPSVPVASREPAKTPEPVPQPAPMPQPASVNVEQAMPAEALEPQTASVALEAPVAAERARPEALAEAMPETMIERLERQGGQVWILAAFFGFGLLLAFTPCVFPMYPILAGVIGQGASGTRRGFFLSVAYVLGLATAFAALGFAAAWSGQNLQMALQSPWAIGIFATVFLVLAASMLGGFDLSLPRWWMDRFNGPTRTGKRSLFSAGGMGFASALIVGPCVTAPLAGALLYITQTGDVVLGASALFALGLGKGVPLVLFGTAGARFLPRAGVWMNHVKAAFGFIFLIMAWWLLSRILPVEAVMVSGALIAFAVAAALIRLGKGGHAALSVPCRALAMAAGLWGALLVAGVALGANDPWRPLSPLSAGSSNGTTETGAYPVAAIVEDAASLEAALQRASARGVPAVVYFTADWCVTCRAVERDVLPASEVAQALGRADLIKVDVTSNTDEVRGLMTEYGVVGPPTMVFVGAEGSERTAGRLVGKITREAMLQGIKMAAEAPR